MKELFGLEEKASGYYQQHKDAEAHRAGITGQIARQDHKRAVANRTFKMPRDPRQEAQDAADRRQDISTLSMQGALSALAISGGRQHWRDNEAAYHDLAVKEAAEQGVTIIIEELPSEAQPVEVHHNK